MPGTLSGDAALSSWSGVDERAVRSIICCETQWTGYYCRADPLLSAVGERQALDDGRCPLWANPFMHPSAWCRAVAAQGVYGDPWHELGALDPWRLGYRHGRMGRPGHLNGGRAVRLAAQ